MNYEAFSLILGLSSLVSLSSILTAIGGYYVLREKVRRTEEDFERFQQQQERQKENFVTFKHFDAVILPLRNTLDNVQLDIKVLLKMIER